jgi:hypothetical protein
MKNQMNNESEVTPPTREEPAWLPILLDMGRNEFYADEQIIPIFNDGTWKAVADYVSSLRAERDATARELTSADAERFICLVHPHNNRWEEALCSAKHQLDAAAKAAVAWKRSAKLNKELWSDEKEVHALRCHDVNTLRTRLTACERERDGAYRERNQVVAWAARMAAALGYTVAVTKTEIEGWDAAWHNCVYIDTPEGQASWHFHDDDAALFADLPHANCAWDGHTTPEKYDRLHRARYRAAAATAQGENDA